MLAMRSASLLSLGILLSGGYAVPAPNSTHNLALRDVPRGIIIEHCTVPGTVALTFDDGPFLHTARVLDLLESYGAKATFFINGENWSRNIDDPATGYPDLLRRIDRLGHQIASHTWSHQDLTYLSEDDRRFQMGQLDKVLLNILGKVPNYMRPPYASCDGDCLPFIESLGYHVVNFDVDTKDYVYKDSPEAMQTAVSNFNAALDSGGPDSSFLVLSHDVHQYTVDVLAPAMLEKIKERGYRAVTVGECLGELPNSWYRV